MPGGWVGSNRRSRLPRHWAALRASVLHRDNYQCTRLEHGVRCWSLATDVDHIQPGGSDTADNLASLCREHHAEKTAQEGNNARTRQAREPEPHPGVVRE